MSSGLKLQVNSREDWGGTPSSPASFAALDEGIIVHWNGPAMGAYRVDDVPGIILNTWRYHVQSNGWADIAYNFSIDRFGDIWTGRGDRKWNAASGTTYANMNYLAVEMLCGEGDGFTDAMKSALERLALAYVESGRAPHAYRHRDVTQTACPGEEIAAHVGALNARMANGLDISLGAASYAPQRNATQAPKTIGALEMPEYLIQATDTTMYGVYASGSVRQLIYPELQYLEKAFADKSVPMIVVKTVNKDNDLIVHSRSVLG